MLETDALKEKLEMEIHRFARPPEELSSGDPYFEQLQTMLAIREELENIPLCDIQRDIDRIQSTAKQAAGKRLNELRRHEFDVNGEPPAELRYFYDLHSEILDNPDLEWVGDMEP